MKQSIHIGYFTEFRLPEWFSGSADVRVTLEHYWNTRYAEFEFDAAQSLNFVLTEILEKLIPDSDHLVHMAVLLGTAIGKTIELHDPSDATPSSILSALRSWREDKSTLSEPTILPYEMDGTTTGHQDWDEAKLAMNAVAEVTDSNRTIPALLRILEICFSGYALGPLAHESMPEDIFRWWLTDIVPATLEQREPDMYYNISTHFPPTLS